MYRSASGHGGSGFCIKVRIIDDGHVAISIEVHGGTIRIHPAVPNDDHPPIIGVGEFSNVTADVVKLSAFRAEGMTTRHVKLIYREMLAMGYRWLVAERMGMHKLPGAETVQEWPFSGWQRVDLVASRLCRQP